jgi:hypothetical protein
MWCEGVKLVKMEIPRKTKFVVYENAYFFIIVVVVMVSQV